MSNRKAMLWALQQSVTGDPRDALAVLADSADGEGVCAASLNSVVHELDLDPWAASDALSALESAGLIRSATGSSGSFVLCFEGAAQPAPDGSWIRPARTSFAIQQMVRIVARDESDGVWRCHYCRVELIQVDQPWVRDGKPHPEREHVIPKVRGGSSRIDNLVLSCTGCNSRKGGKLLTELPADWHRWRDQQAVR